MRSKNKIKHYSKCVFKLIVFVLCFIILLTVLQTLYSPNTEQRDKILGNMVHDYYELDKNSLEALFVGSSQMFCTINAQMLTEKYGIESYDFGARGQTLPITYYYLKEALKTQKPKVVVVEVAAFFGFDLTEQQIIAWNYLPAPLSINKYLSLQEQFHGDKLAALQYCCVPLLTYHKFWNQYNPVRMIKKTTTDTPVHLSRGFLSNYAISEKNYDISYLQKEMGEYRQPDDATVIAIDNIAKICKQCGAEVLFFKSPSHTWTRTNSDVVKRFMDERNYSYLELNDYLNDIELDYTTNFSGKDHLNTDGANKVTEFFAQYLVHKYDGFNELEER